MSAGLDWRLYTFIKPYGCPLGHAEWSLIVVSMSLYDIVFPYVVFRFTTEDYVQL